MDFSIPERVQTASNSGQYPISVLKSVIASAWVTSAAGVGDSAISRLALKHASLGCLHQTLVCLISCIDKAMSELDVC